MEKLVEPAHPFPKLGDEEMSTAFANAAERLTFSLEH
jgi:hypothetical protein